MKLKKILSAVTALTMGVTMMCAMNITASAEDKGEVSCSTNDAIYNAVYGLTDGDSIVINVTSDTSDEQTFVISGSDVTINLNGHTLSKITMNVTKTYEQTIKVNNGTICGPDINVGYAPSALSIKNAKLICENVEIYGGNGLADGAEGGYGIICGSSDDRIELNNCYVSSGDSINTHAQSAIAGYGGNTLIATDTTFARGTGTPVPDYPLVRNATLQNAEGTTYQLPDYTESTFKVGKGYIKKVLGNVITQDDGTPAQADSPVTAAATIPTPKYTVTIPASIDFGDVTAVLPKHKGEAGTTVSKNFKVVCTSAENLFDGDYIAVTISQDENSVFKLYNKDETYSIDCALKKGSDNYTLGNEFAKFIATVDAKATSYTNSQTGTITLDRTDITKDVATKGNMTFTITVKEAV